MKTETLAYQAQCSQCPWSWSDVDLRLVYEALDDHLARRHGQ